MYRNVRLLVLCMLVVLMLTLVFVSPPASFTSAPMVVQPTMPWEQPNVYEMYGPRLDNIHYVFTGSCEASFLALDVGVVDIIDCPLSAYWKDEWEKPERTDIKMMSYGEVSAKAWRTYKKGTVPEPGNEWKGMVNQTGQGVNNWWTFLNAHTDNEPDSGSVFYGLSYTSIDVLNPVYASWYPSWEILDKLYDSLLKLDPIEMVTMRPWIASDFIHVKEYDPVQDEMVSVLYFTIRKDVYWHDGQQLTADDVIFTLDYLPAKLEERGLPPPWWDSSVADINRTDKIDDFNIKVYMEYPTDFAPYYVGGNIILPEHVWKPIVDSGNPEAFAPDPNMIGSGPYQMDSSDYVAGVSCDVYAYKPASVGYFQYSPIQNFIVMGEKATPNPNTSTYWVGASYVGAVKVAVKIYNNALYNTIAVTATLDGQVQNVIVPPDSWKGLRFPYPIAGGIGATIGPILFNEQTTWTTPPQPGIDTCTEIIYFKVTVDGDVISTGAPGVNLFDGVALSRNWGPSGPYNYPPADINWDGTVDIFDALIIMGAI